MLTSNVGSNPDLEKHCVVLREQHKVVTQKNTPIGLRASCHELRLASGDNAGGVPPVPIPNTEVKPFRAENTWTAGSREGRSLPDRKSSTLYGYWTF